MKSKLIYAAGTVLLSAMAAPAALDYLYSEDGTNWNTRTVAAVSLTAPALAPDPKQALHVISGVDENGDWYRYANTSNSGTVADDGTFPGGLTLSGNYQAVSSMNVANNFLGASSDGGLYRLYYHNSQWNAGLVNPAATNLYLAMACHKQGTIYQTAAARAGALDRVYLSGQTFVLETIETGYTYEKLDALNRSADYYIGLTDSGNINGIEFQSGFQSRPDIRAAGFSGKYVDITADPVNGANWEFLGVRETGVIDRFASSSSAGGDTFTSSAVGDSAAFYTAVIGDPDNSNVYYALKEGGVDRIYYDGGWQYQEISTAGYDLLGMDYTKAAGTFAVYAATAPGTANIDGVPVSWILQHWDTTDEYVSGADDDSDGLTNAEEYFADTSPVDVNSTLAVQDVEINGNTVTVSYLNGGSNATVFVEHRDALSAGAWSRIATNATPASSSNSYDHVNAAANGFYRLSAQRID